MFRVDANAQLYNTFSAEQSYNFLTYRQALTKAGVGKFLDRAKGLISSGCKVLCIDVAHGHHVLMQEAIEKWTEIKKVNSQLKLHPLLPLF